MQIAVMKPRSRIVQIAASRQFGDPPACSKMRSDHTQSA